MDLRIRKLQGMKSAAIVLGLLFALELSVSKFVKYNAIKQTEKCTA